MAFHQEDSTCEKTTDINTRSIRVCVHAHLHQHSHAHSKMDSLQGSQNVTGSFQPPFSQIRYSQVSSALMRNPTPTSRTKSYEIELRDLSYKRKAPCKLSSRLGILGINFEGESMVEDTAVSPYILKQVNLKAHPGEILGVAGPSGAGKSTLLEVLAGRLRPSSPPSSILINEQEMNVQQFRRISGYVMQEDALFPLLTVEETLMYSARLRLPASVSLSEKAIRVQAIMKELGLLHVASSRVGDEHIRGLSGGEKRRVSIGVDVIHDPAVLILDEPTSGLDSASALQVVSMLSRMAVSHNRTIILSIHQPSYRILELLHSILLLAGGTVFHHGPLDLLAARLAASGHIIPDQVNVLEYAIDAIKNWNITSISWRPMLEEAEESGPTLTLQCTFDLESAPLSLLAPPECEIHGGDASVTFANSNWQEIVVLAQRLSKNVYRTKQVFKARTLHSLAAGLILGSIYAHMGFGTRGISERSGLLAFSVTLLLTSTIEVLHTFLDECRITSCETSRGAYRMSSYVVSNTLVFLPFLFLNAVLFSVPLYWLVGLAPEASPFLFFLLVVWLLLVTAYSFVAFFSALVSNYQLGYTLIMGSMGCFFLFSGFFISKQNLPTYWLFMHYISLYKYPLESLLINEFSNVSNRCFGTLLFNGTECTLSGSEALVQGGIDGHRHTKWINVGIMAGFAVLYRILCFFVLRFKMGRRNR